MDNNYYVYKHTSPEDKIYIGITSSETPEQRWKNGHGYQNNELFWEDIQKFGWDNFQHDIIAQNISKEEAITMENSLIKLYSSNNPVYGYNQNEGGAGAYKTIYILMDNGSTTSLKISKNQKIIKIHRIKNGINFEANFKAMKKLSLNTYVLYMYLMMHDNNRIWALYSQDVMNRTHLTKNTYPNAVNELIDKQYLTSSTINTTDGVFSENVYDLWEDPEKQFN